MSTNSCQSNQHEVPIKDMLNNMTVFPVAYLDKWALKVVMTYKTIDREPKFIARGGHRANPTCVITL